MRVDGRRDPVGGPPGVGDAHVHLVLHLKVELLRAGLDLLLEVLHIALLLDQGRLLVGLAAIDADSYSIVCRLGNRSRTLPALA